MTGFYVGDRVVLITDRPDCNEDMHPGLTGTVVQLDDQEQDCPRIGVAWDREIGGHSCDNNCESGFGWYVDESDIQPETDDTEPAAFSELREFIGF